MPEPASPSEPVSVGIGAVAGGIFARKPEPPSKTDAPVRKPEDLD